MTWLNAGEQKMIDMRQLLNVFCSKNEMIESKIKTKIKGKGRKNERQKNIFNIFSAQLLIAYFP